MTNATTLDTQTAALALAALDKVNDKLIRLLPVARNMDVGNQSTAFSVSRIQSVAGELYEITSRNLQRDADPERISRKLMTVAGMLSDVQEYYYVEYEVFEDEDGLEYDDPETGGSLLPTEVNDLINQIKSDIFDVIEMVDPRR